tara:strand:- start:40 stop:381 length:342 start_codon:yes stop_codon:yes gene_type:complete
VRRKDISAAMMSGGVFDRFKLRQRRLVLGLSLKDMADLADRPHWQDYVSRWERGIKSPSASSIRILAELLGCEVEDFMSTPKDLAAKTTPNRLHEIVKDARRIVRIWEKGNGK